MAEEIKAESIVLESIEDLQERWKTLKLQEGLEEILITEDFMRTGRKTYQVIGLSMEIEEDYVMCEDIGNIIPSKFCTLMMFLKESLTKIMLIPISNGYRERLEFGKDGVIFIEKK